MSLHIFAVKHFAYFLKLMWLTGAVASISSESIFTDTFIVNTIGVWTAVFTRLDLYVIIHSSTNLFILSLNHLFVYSLRCKSGNMGYA